MVNNNHVSIIIIKIVINLRVSAEQCCHSPTQPQLELELDLIMGRKPPPPTHPPGTFKALPGNLGS